jgi:hypothetical protein
MRALHAGVVLVLTLTAARAERLDRAEGPAPVEIIVHGLQSPAGLAVHPATREIYVAEKRAGRVSVIRDGRAEPVIKPGWGLQRDLPKWALSATRTESHWYEARLRDPAALAFLPDGRLLVAEEAANGRLLAFTPDEQGGFTNAAIVPVPWLDRAFSWVDLKVTGDGRWFLVGLDRTSGPLTFGTVLMRSREEEWWVVDFGPFADFAGAALSSDDDILVLSERLKGGLVWWDSGRHVCLGTIEESTRDATADALCLAKDGAMVIAENPAPGAAAGAEGRGRSSRILRVNPVTGEQTILATGLRRIGGLALLPESGNLCASEAESGLLLELRPPQDLLSAQYLLRRSADDRAPAEGLPPKEAPPFLKHFLARLGVESPVRTMGEPAGGRGPEDRASEADAASRFTLRDFAKRIPIIAGKVTTTPVSEEEDPDPIVSLDFLLFYPGRVVKTADLATPSLSFFSATRSSGRAERTKVFYQGVANERSARGWALKSSTARLYVPLAICNLERTKDEMELYLTFLGLGVYDDYHLQLATGREKRGSLVVEGRFGTRSEYALTAEEEDAESGMMVRNLVIEGFDPAHAEELGWLNIGREPVATSVALEEKPTPRFFALGEEIRQLIEQKKLQMRLEADAAPADAATPAGGAAETATAGDPEPANP